jgi:hypothetical protein
MSIQWGRVLLAAFLMELVLFAIAIPLFLSGAGRVNFYVVPPVALVATFAVTVWLGRGLPRTSSCTACSSASLAHSCTSVSPACNRNHGNTWSPTR